MAGVLRIMSIFFLLNINTNSLAVEAVDKIKEKSETVFKTLTRKSLTKNEILKFLAMYVIIIDDKRDDGTVTYFFEDKTYKRYKDLKLISEDKWKISKFGYLNIFYNGKKNSWKIQPAKRNTISIKKKIASVGKLYDFVYEDKTDYYLKLEEKKLNSTDN
jgi:hypothetical protein